MGTSFHLFRFRGIDVRVHWSFVLILAFGAFAFGRVPGEPVTLASALFGVLTVVLLFACVTLHEFGHALVAQHFNIGVPSITLLPIGGVASLERMPDKPMQEFLITIAGPAVNFALAAVLLPLAFVLREPGLPLSGIFSLVPEGTVSGLIRYLFSINIALGLFNLLPAFPMDGGRILRAVLAFNMPYVRATRIAVFVGRIMAVIFAFVGLFGGGNILLLLIAFFVYVGGGAEREAVESRTVLRNVQARDALTAGATSLYTSERAERAVDLIMNSYQTDYPVLDLGSNFVGVLTRGRLIYALKQTGPDARIGDVMKPAGEIPALPPTASLAEVWEQIASSGSRVVAIKEGAQFLGLITTDDITEVFQVMSAAMDGPSDRQMVESLTTPTPTGTSEA